MEEQFNQIKNKKKISDVIKKKLNAAITYLTNQLSRMNYFEYRAKNLPIDSVVTEAECKSLNQTTFVSLRYAMERQRCKSCDCIEGFSSNN